MIARIVIVLLSGAWIPAVATPACGMAPVQVQTLGPGGPGLGKRAAGAYLVWLDGKPRALIDIGAGAALRFREAGANVADLDVILLTRLHVDRTADLPALVDSSLAENRDRPLPLYGPSGNKFMPSTVTFVRTLFDNTRGAYRYLGNFLNPLAKDTYKLRPNDVGEERRGLGARRAPDPDILSVFANERLRTSAVYVAHGSAPALAWRVDAGTKSIAFSEDSGGGGLERLIKNADLLIVNLSVPATMPSSVVARLAQAAGVKQLVLTPRASENETEVLEYIKKHFAGPVAFASDLECFTP
ncbi:MBL fold metallo-hydrolase [Sulfuricaulis sp.]|uniref:MBL fold metallo-hydrolase n=1 Tax=Sulfuricaulis sp. TaxID=2003553 RepID=UPI00355A44FA